jgi:hypothetical protein
MKIRKYSVVISFSAKPQFPEFPRKNKNWEILSDKDLFTYQLTKKKECPFRYVYIREQQFMFVLIIFSLEKV